MSHCTLPLAMRMLLTAVICVMSTAVAITPTPLLPNCPPGTYLSKSSDGQEVCLPCRAGTYMDTFGRKTSCKDHRVCKKSEELLVAGTPTSNVVCTCKSGGRRYYSVDEVYGYDCYPCEEGKVRLNVTDPFDEGDTGCCAPDSKAFRDKQGILWCHQLDRVTPLGVFTTASTTSYPEVPTAETWPWWIYFIIAASTTFIIVFIIIGIAIFVERQRQRRQVTSTEEGQSLT